MRLQQDAELQCYRALEAEARKWEAREERLAEQLAELRKELHTKKTECDRLLAKDLPGASMDDRVTPRPLMTQESTEDETHRESPCRARGDVELEGSPTATEQRRDRQTEATTIQLSQALLAQQLPPIPKFAGEERHQGGETIEDWKEQFEMVATLGGWDEHAKLVNLITRLRGQAYAFYRSCTLQQRASYPTLMEELVKRFTPVRLKAVQSSQFHERKQKPQESVDDYAQDLRQLFHKAYPMVQRGSREAEEMGRAVLSNQFISGLRPELKTKVAGTDGDFDVLLTKTRFDEAKRRDITGPAAWSKPPFQTRHKLPPRADTTSAGSLPSPGGIQQQNKLGIKCFICGVSGHMARSCPKNRRSGLAEAGGRPLPFRDLPARNGAQNQVATVVREQDLLGVNAAVQQGPQEQMTATQRQEIALEGVLDQVTATMHGLAPTCGKQGSQLGPTLTTEVQVEGVPVQALLDTGSPATIISLDLIVQVLAASPGFCTTGDKYRWSRSWPSPETGLEKTVDWWHTRSGPWWWWWNDQEGERATNCARTYPPGGTLASKGCSYTGNHSGQRNQGSCPSTPSCTTASPSPKAIASKSGGASGWEPHYLWARTGTHRERWVEYSRSHSSARQEPNRDPYSWECKLRAN